MLPTLTGVASQHTVQRPVTITDAIEMTRLGESYYAHKGGPYSGEAAQFSPDGQRFVIVLRKGDVASNTNEYRILLWRTSDVFHAPQAETILTISSSSNAPAIDGVRWLTDNETMMFAAENGGGVRQIYSLNLRTRALINVSRSASGVEDWSTDANGQVITYTAGTPERELWNARTEREGVVIEAQPLASLMAGKMGSDKRLFVRSSMDPEQPAIQVSVPSGFGEPSLSPDGRYIVLFFDVDAYPGAWKKYRDPSLRKWIQLPLPAGTRSFIQRSLLIDTRTKSSRVLLDAPAIGHVVSWAPDSRSVVLSGTYLPLEHFRGQDREARSATGRVLATVAIPSGEVIKFEPLLRNGDDTGSAERAIAAKEAADRAIAAQQARPRIVIDEDMNNRPRIFAIEPATNHRVLLLDLNPQFEKLKFAEVEDITWKGSDGTSVKGGLYYPVDYAPGKRYPLVVQTHGWMADRFWIDGFATTAFAAQPLAGQNIMVLQADQGLGVGKRAPDDFDTLKESQREVARLEGGIDYRDRQGLIDRERVGTIGFSRTGRFVGYALAFSTYHFAAAAVQDGISDGYFAYLAAANSTMGVSEFDLIYGAAPFEVGLKTWMQVSPGFHLDRINTPLRLLIPSPGALTRDWEYFAGMRRLGKPVDMVLMHDASHVVEKPADRMIGQDGNVDWFRFWLKGEEDPDPRKAAQYARWRELRKLQVANVAKAAFH
jgi:dipeptidyl aminopeptidase/acylaminoacyl peptidase